MPIMCILVVELLCQTVKGQGGDQRGVGAGAELNSFQ
jgi:hypothetical protein